MSGTFTVELGSLRLADRPRVGGKCANLGELTAAGIDVPAGYAVTVEAFEEVGRLDHLAGALRALVDAVDPTSTTDLLAVQEKAAAMVMSARLPEGFEDEVRSGYAELCRRAGRDDLPVAVRSSAVAEDGHASSFAGQQETYLWVVGADDVLDRIRACWASLFTPQAVAYRGKLDEATRAEAIRMSVAVQEMVAADVAGVAFTVSPTSGDPSVVAVNASWGLGEAVVSGEVTPDEYWLSKIGPTITRSTVSRKRTRCVPSTTGKGTTMVDVPEDLQDVACLSDDELLELTALAIRIEKHYGSAQDIEWAMVRPADGGASRFLLLQSRPDTTHVASLAARRPAAEAGTASYLSVLQKLGATTRGR